MVILIFILALVLRLINLNQSLWLDEAVQAITAQNSIAYIFQEIIGDFHPPLYHFLMHYWVRLFGSSEIALRMPSVLFGVGTIFILYKFTMHMHGKFVRVAPFLLLATSPFHIYYSQEARLYSMSVFFTSLSFYFFLKSGIFSGSKNQKSKIRDKKKNLKVKNIDLNFLWYFLTTLCLIYTDYYGFLILLAQSIYVVWKRKYNFFIFHFLFFIFYLPWLPMFIRQIKAGMLATQILPGWGKLVNVSFLKAIPLTLIKFTIGRITIFDKKIYGLVSVGIITFVGWIVGKGFFSSKFKVQSSKLQLKVKSCYLMIFLWFVVPLFVSWMASLFVPNFQPFRLLLVLPAFYLLVAWGISAANTSMIRIIEISIIVGMSLISLSTYYFNPYFHREDWKGLTSYLLREERITVLLPSSTSSWPIRYYDPGNWIRIVYSRKGVEKLEDRIFYIRYLVPLFDPDEKILAELSAGGYTKIKEISFNQIPVWKFEKTKK